jgi:hypothetical protein
MGTPCGSVVIPRLHAEGFAHPTSVFRDPPRQNIHGWLLTLDTFDYSDGYSAKLRLLRVIQDFLRLKPAAWTMTELKYLQKAAG